MSDTQMHDDDTLDESVQKVGADLERGARRATRAAKEAIDDGADAIDRVLNPNFAESLSDAMHAIAEDPTDTPEIVRELIREHPIASTATIAAAAVVVHRLWSLLSRR